MSRKVVGLCALSAVAVVFACLFIMTVGAGCQTAGQQVSAKPDVLCPDCQAVTVTSSIKGMNFTTYKCSTCAKTFELDTSGGYLPPKEVLVCPHCGVVMMECPECKAKHGM